MEDKLLNDKLRINYICKDCKVHTEQKKVSRQGKEVWVCLECEQIQEEVKKNG